MPVVNDSEIHGPTAWKRDLIAAGWEELRHTIWRAPNGGLYRGPYGAWCEMQRQQGQVARTPDGKGDE